MTTAPAPESPSPFLPALILPTYNNAATLGGVLARCLTLGLPTYVIDDGCTDNTAAVLAPFSANSNLHIRTHDQNQGKAGAMRTGFAAALADGCSHAVTVDTDGQLDPEQVPDLLAAAEKAPTALVLGTRDFQIAGYPPRSRLGRRVSNTFIWIESGQTVQDSQCGLRVYPLGFTAVVPVRSGRYGYETEVITRAAWAGTPIVEVPVTCRYFPDDERVSHFKPWRDSMRAVSLHVRLLLRSLAPWPHRKWPVGQKDARPWWRRLIHWVNPMDLWRQARLERRAGPLAAALAVGVFIANLPVYGLHAILCLYAARRLRLHPLGVLAGSLVALPPLAILLIELAIGVGHWIIHGQWLWLRLSKLNPDNHTWFKALSLYIQEWTIGGLIIGVLMGLVTYALVFVLVHVLPRQKPLPPQDGTLAAEFSASAPDSTASAPVSPRAPLAPPLPISTVLPAARSVRAGK